jgi:hypothetical protein
MATKTKAAAKTCASCSFYKEKTATKGECRRRAPQTVVFQVDEKTKFDSRFPSTKATDWCGEYAKG